MKKSMVFQALHAKLAKEELDDTEIDGVSEAVDDSDIGTDADNKEKEVVDADPANAEGDEGEPGAAGDDVGVVDETEVKVDEDANRSDDSGAADASGEGEGEGAEEKKEPSPDAEVTELPDELDEQPNTEESEKDDADDEDEVEEEEESEEEIAEKADAVADLADAKQSLEEIAEQIEATLQDGGLTPEAAVVAQGAVDDVLESVDVTPIGLPSQESFGTFEGRRANTRLVLESVAAGVAKIAMKIYEFIRKMISMIFNRSKDSSVKLKATENKAAQAIAQVKQAKPFRERLTIEVTGTTARMFFLPKDVFDGRLTGKDIHTIAFDVAKVGATLRDTANLASKSLDPAGHFDLGKLSNNKVLGYHLNGDRSGKYHDELAFGWYEPLQLIRKKEDALDSFELEVNSMDDVLKILECAKTLSEDGIEFAKDTASALQSIDKTIVKLEAQAKSGGEKPTRDQEVALGLVKVLLAEITSEQMLFTTLSHAVLNVGMDLHIAASKKGETDV